MDKADLLKLLTLKDVSAGEVRTREPELWDRVVADTQGEVRARITAALEATSPAIREHVARLDLTRVARRDLAAHVRAAVAAAALPAEEVRVATERLDNLAATLMPTAGVEDETRPIRENPEFAPLLEKARFFQVAEIARLEDAVVEAVAADAPGPSAMSAVVLDRLVEAGRLTEAQASALGTAATVYELADENPNLATAIHTSRFARLGDRAPEATRDLAMLQRSDWEDVVGRDGVRIPDGTTAAGFASRLADRFASLHPDVAFVARLPRMNQDEIAGSVEKLQALIEGNQHVLGASFESLATEGVAAANLEALRATHDGLRRLARAYPGMRLAEVLDDPDRSAADKANIVTRRVSLIEKVHANVGDGPILELDYSPESPDLARLDLGTLEATDDERAMVLSTLKAYQRSFALTRHVDDARQLMQAGFTSGTQIATRSLADFQKAVGLDPVRAERYWREARSTLIDGTLAFTGIIDAHWGLFDNLAVGNLLPDARDYLRKIPGYEALFGGLSFCACEHCQSVLGPAAYFVDLMKFVDDHVRPQFENRANHPLDLKVRRPDLWTLELTCANMNDRVPTLDIVNEILENFIARQRGYAGVLTDRSAVGGVVYPALADSANSFAQPFHLPLARVDAYLNKLEDDRTRRASDRESSAEISRAEVTRALGASPETAAAAELSLSPKEWQLVTQPEADLGRLSKLYDFAFTPAGAGVAPVDAQDLIRATDLKRAELGDLAATRFVAAGGANVTFRAEKRSAESVQNDIEKIHGLTADALDRVHRFTRLWRKLPWSIAELDRLLTTLSDSTLSAGAVTQVATVRRVQRQLGLTVDESCGLVGALPQTPAGNSLFDRLFNPPEIAPAARFPNDATRFVHPAFRRDTSVPPDPALPRLFEGLNVDLDGLATLIRRLAPFLATEATPGFNPNAPNEDDRYFVLSAANLSLLYRHARLARSLNLSIEDLFQLVGFAGVGGRIATATDLPHLLDWHTWWKTSGYQLDDISVATGGTPREPGRYIDPPALAAEVKRGADDVLVFRDTIFAVALGTTEEDSRDLLKNNPGLVETTVDGHWRLVAGADIEGTIAIPATATIVQPSPAAARAVTADEVREVLRPYLPAALIARQLGLRFNFAPEKVEALARLAGSPLSAQPLARALRATEPIDPLRDLIAGLRPLVVAFRGPEWDVNAIEFAREHADHADRFALALPVITVENLRALSVYARIARRRVGTGSDERPVDPADLRSALLSFDTATREFSSAADEALGRVSEVSPGMLAGLRGRIALPAVGARALDVLGHATRLCTSLGVDGEALAAAASDQYDSLARAADAILSGLRAKYPGEAERTRELAVVEDRIREAKRNALVGYLVHSLEQKIFRSGDDLYQYFLIDVKSGGCATTSRVVAAISSVQLYIHRVIMNLEQTAIGAVDPLQVQLPDVARAEWTWRKNYRVWEANRKVFLWPENYVEPDLRDDKTPLFKELEGELLQTDITDQNVLDAYTKYLKGFEEVASLTIAGAYHDVRIEDERTVDVLHLFGVSSTDPPTFYYRTCEGLIASGRDPKKAALWSPWRKIDVQITGRRVSPVVYLDRLHVFWTDYKTRSINRVEGGTSKFDGYQHTLSLKFTTLRPDGRWTPPQPVDLPSWPYYTSGGRGVLRDPIGKDKRPALDDRVHDEPIEDYTLSGPNWDWIWIESGVAARRGVLSVRYRNFLGYGWLDLFGRKLVTELAEVIPRPHPQVLCARSGKLHYGSPTKWNGILPLRGAAATANLVIHDTRLGAFFREIENAAQARTLVETGLYVEPPIATLRPGTELLAIPGSVEDAIVQVGPDVILIQGSVTDDDSYVLRRIGTTLGEEIARRLFVDGVDGLLDIETQKDGLLEAKPPLTLTGSRIEDRSNSEELDFQGAYGVYYREIFFHIPFLIANALNSRGRFAAAQRWYHFIFDPTATDIITVDAAAPPEEKARRALDRVWRYIEFRWLDSVRLREILTDENALAVYRKDPFNPHAIARLRLSAYQKAIVMKYVDNLLDWGDHLFAQYLPEPLNEALMLYIMASDILGPRPARLGDCGEGPIQPKTYEKIAPTIGKGEEILIELETWVRGRQYRDGRYEFVSRPRFGTDYTRVARAFERFPLVASSRIPGFGVTDPVPTALPPPARVATRLARRVREGRPPPAAAVEESLFRGPALNETRIAAWTAPLGTSRTAPLGTSRMVNADGGLTRVRAERTLGVAHYDPRYYAVDKSVGAFGWSIVRQLGPVFCIPPNKDLLAYYDRVEDRLEKLRNCKDITGQKRELPLFAPEIDPRLLVRMRVEGLTLEDVLGTTSGSLPPYRFIYLIDRAKAFASSLSGFGAALLSTIEKKDGEELARLRILHQENLARMTTQLRRWDIQVAEQALAMVQAQKEAAEYRRDFYDGLIQQNRTGNEYAQSAARHFASATYTAEAVIQFVAAAVGLVPQVGSPFAMKYGGVELNNSFQSFGAASKAQAQVAEAVAASAGLEAGFERRLEGWRHQKDLATHDIRQLDRQIKAAEIRVEIAKRSLDLHDKSIEQLDEMLELMKNKFSSLGLYTWLAAELRRLYRDAYNNALALARLTEQAFRFERGDESSPGLAPTYWDPTHGGMLAGEKLLMALQNLERRYLETNYRSLEVDQRFALSQVAPDALVQLRETGECRFEISEVFFKLFYPGHYKQRIKAVRLTIPCITGPYVNVSATLTLENSKIRPTAARDGGLVDVPPRRSVSVATSTAQNDAGVFELSFRDERYTPFEGAGAISKWHLALPKSFRQFDYQTINDVILSISYTAEQDDELRQRVEADNAALEGSILHYLSNNSIGRLFSLRQDFSHAFTRLLHSPIGTAVPIEISESHFPLIARGRRLSVTKSALVVRTAEGITTGTFRISVDGAAVTGFAPNATLAGLLAQPLPAAFTGNLPSPQARKVVHTLALEDAGDLAPAAAPPGVPSAVDADKLYDLLVYLEYKIVTP